MANGTYELRWPLERNVWDAVADFYSGNKNDVRNLQERLTDYADLIPLARSATRIGLEGLIQYLPVKVLEQIVKTKFYGPDETKKRKKQKEHKVRGYKGLVQKGVAAIFDGTQHSLLKPETMEARDWLVRYAALLDIVNHENKLAEDVFEVVMGVNNALRFYYNIESERSYFFDKLGCPMTDGGGKPKIKDSKKGYRLGNVAANVETNRRIVRKIGSDDPFVTKLVKEVVNHSYFVSEVIFTTLFGHATSLKEEVVREMGIDLREWEEARVEIGRQIRSDRYFNRLSEPTREFYLGRTRVVDLVKKD